MGKNDYFEFCVSQMNYCCLSSELLCDVLKGRYVKDIDLAIVKNDELCKNALRLYDETKLKLSKEFITPLEHNDFLILLQNILYIHNEIKNIMSLLSVYHIHEVFNNLNEMSLLLNDINQSLKSILIELKNYKKSDKLKFLFIEVKTFGYLADKKYKEGLEELINKTYDYKKIITYHKVYDYFKRNFDLCVYTSDMIEQIIMRNT